MSQLSRIAFISTLVAGSLACGLTSIPFSGVQNAAATAEAMATGLPNVAATAEAMATALPSSMPNIPDVTQYMNPTGAATTDWNGIPIMPQAIVGQEFNKTTYGFKVGTVSQAEVQAFYMDKLKALGWTSTFNAGAGIGAIMTFTKGSSSLTVAITKSDTDTSVMLILK
jgi:hypothetical protein